MDIAATIRDIERRKPEPPSQRATHGIWIKPAWVVRHLVERKKWTVSDAVREVVATENYEDPAAAFKGIRAAYYLVKDKPWEEGA